MSVVVIQSLRAFRRAVLFGLIACWVVGLLSLRLSVCAFDRGCVLRTFKELVLAASWAILGALWVAWALFWDLWASHGVHVWGSGASLGLHF